MLGLVNGVTAASAARDGDEQALLRRARDGDEQAFREVTDPFRRELQVHCYRMLGSLTDAEDMLQETLLAAWRGLAGFQQRSSLRGWLYRIATNQCLNALRAASRRLPAEPVPPFQPPEPTRRGEVTWLQPYPDDLLEGIPDTAPGPDARYQVTEAVEIAFITGLQRMPPRQAAALLLRDVLGFDSHEAASMLNTTPTAVKGALQRARAALDGQLSESGRGGEPRPDPAAERALARRFAQAYVAADIDGVVALLTDDAWLSMPPAPHQYHGIDAIRAMLGASFGHRGDRRMYLVPARANGQPALGGYLSGYLSGSAGGASAAGAGGAGGAGVAGGAGGAGVAGGAGGAAPSGLFVFTVAGERIRAITRFHLDELYPRFGLPMSLSPASAGQAIGAQ